jgi:hypothetical protein
MAIFNGTTHDVNVFNPTSVGLNSTNRKLETLKGAIPQTIYPKDRMLNATPGKEVDAGTLPDGTPLKRKTHPTGVDNPWEVYPEAVEGDLSIVSVMYLTAVRELGGDTSHLLTVGGTVFTDGRLSGCTYLIPN